MPDKHHSARPLPGEPAGRDLVARVLRVDHAGEYGARRIYEGQLAVLGDTEAGTVIRDMAANETEHLDWLDRELNARKVRPTALHPIWHVAGYALGAATALAGPRAAMACTVAVEEAIDAHYRGQLAALGESEPRLSEALDRFRTDECAHRDTALQHEAEQAPAYRAMSAAIRAGCRLAIWMSERI